MSDSKRLDWPRAWRAIQTMRSDPSRTDQVFELNVALDGGDSERRPLPGWRARCSSLWVTR